MSARGSHGTRTQTHDAVMMAQLGALCTVVLSDDATALVQQVKHALSTTAPPPLTTTAEPRHSMSALPTAVHRLTSLVKDIERLVHTEAPLRLLEIVTRRLRAHRENLMRHQCKEDMCRGLAECCVRTVQRQQRASIMTMDVTPTLPSSHRYAGDGEDGKAVEKGAEEEQDFTIHGLTMWITPMLPMVPTMPSPTTTATNTTDHQRVTGGAPVGGGRRYTSVHGATVEEFRNDIDDQCANVEGAIQAHLARYNGEVAPTLRIVAEADDAADTKLALLRCVCVCVTVRAVCWASISCTHL